MRTAFIETLLKNDDNVFLLTGDLGYSVIDRFSDKNPDRFLNCGVAEQNMSGIAAGLAIEGYKVFTYSIANFNTLRCIEQIRNDICYNNLDVTIVSVGGGFVYGTAGYSHHAIQDIGMMGSMPNMTLLLPSDPYETALCVDYALSNKGPKYLRIGRNGEKNITHGGVFNSYREVKLQNESDVLIATTGGMLSVATETSEILARQNIKADVFSFPIIGNEFDSIFRNASEKYTSIITIEESLAQFGFSALVLNSVSLKSKRVIPFGVCRDLCSVVGSQDYLRKIHSLDAKTVAEKVNRILKSCN